MKIQKSKILADISGETGVIRFLWATVRDAADAQKAVSEIEDVAYNHKVSVIVINFSRLVQLTSVFLGRLIQVQKSLKQVGTQLRACGMSPDVEKAFKICKLDKLIPSYATEEEAING